MEKITAYLRKPAIAIGLGVILGLILGLIIGWGIWPVEYVNVEPQHLRDDLKTDYLCMVMESYYQTMDVERAKSRWQSLGEGAPQVLKTINQQTCNSILPMDVAEFSALVGVPVLPDQPGQQTTVQPTEAPKTGGGNSFWLLVVLCVVTLLVAAALVYFLLLRKRGGNRNSPQAQALEASRTAVMTDYSTQDHEPPVSQFMTTYVGGDDLYDDSFSVETQTGEFLGECGVGISETIGVGDPKKVTAFEVWLFDKNDIQTVTKVLMSANAYNDQALRARLASKGEAVLVEPGKHILMETATLQLQARVVDMSYGQGALPNSSFFERLTLELAIWPKPKA
jgi:hypothetical protein